MKTLNAALCCLFVSAGFNSAWAGDCSNYSAMLDKCQPYSCQFKHPFTGTLMEKKILGEKSGKCLTYEQMPANGRMECAYSKQLRSDVAKYLAQLETAEKTGASIKTKSSVKMPKIRGHIDMNGSEDPTMEITSEGETNVTTKTYIDGEEISSPMQETLNNGTCKISGYD